MPWTPDSYLTKDEYDRLADKDQTLHDLIITAESKYGADWLDR